jgi:DeoR/GlpR family transcriptional regulator of sugar metabolism
MAKLSANDRRKKLLEALVSKDNIKVGELAASFSVSTETIRKDLLYLEQDGLVRKQHGKALVMGSLAERPYSQKADENKAAKQLIAQAAVKLIPPRATVILDSGSTTYEIAKLLSIQENLVIFTNSVSIMQLLSVSKNQAFIVGGEIRKSSMALVGAWALNALKSIQADIAFMGTDGFAGRPGPCSASYEELEIKKAMIQSAAARILVCDSSKFARADMFVYCGWEDIDTAITDSGASSAELDRIRQYTTVTIAEPAS